jgi:hypothetical protein
MSTEEVAMARNVLMASVATAACVLGASAQSPLATAAPYAPRALAGVDGNPANYQWDDGTTENALGWTVSGDFCFIARFDVVGGGSDVITKVLAAFGNVGGTTVHPGTPVRVFVWDDPTDDDDPLDCGLRSSATGITMSPNTDTLEPFPVPAALVTARFYVGAVIPGLAGTFPGPMDTTNVVPNVAWLTGNAMIGTYVGTPILGDKGMFKMSAGFFACNWLLRAEGGNSDVVYCTAKVNSLGCVPAIASTGPASATAASGHLVRVTQTRNGQLGMLIYGVNGQAAIPTYGGTLCVAAPCKRTRPTGSGGSPAPIVDCSGVHAIDLNAFAQGGYPTPLPALQVVGTTVNCQFWARDPGFPAPNDVSLSDGLEYVVGP